VNERLHFIPQHNQPTQGFFPLTMATQTSNILKYATRGARTLTEHFGRRQVTTNLLCAKGISVSRNFGTRQNDGFLISEKDEFAANPEPLLAYAYAYDYDDGEEDGSMNSANTFSSTARSARGATIYDVTNRRSGGPLASAGGGPPDSRGPSSSAPYPPPSSMASGKGRNIGGGGNGRHRCPKCGTTVTFRCDYEENTFYCASCSSWFAVSPSTIMSREEEKGEDGSPYEEFMGKTRPRNVAEPEIMMRHVSVNSDLQESPFFFISFHVYMLICVAGTGAPSAVCTRS
jgi:predicted RNA-binding Zn-ribbon protein involved in translation (DUF1610 family)